MAKGASGVSKKKKIEFSKKLLCLDYIIAVILMETFFYFMYRNGVYMERITEEMVSSGMDATYVTAPYSLDTIGVIMTAWITQLGVSSGAYYLMARAEHQVQIPMAMLNTMPENVQEKLDMNSIIIALLGSTNN